MRKDRGKSDYVFLVRGEVAADISSGRKSSEF